MPHTDRDKRLVLAVAFSTGKQTSNPSYGPHEVGLLDPELEEYPGSGD